MGGVGFAALASSLAVNGVLAWRLYRRRLAEEGRAAESAAAIASEREQRRLKHEANNRLQAQNLALQVLVEQLRLGDVPGVPRPPDAHADAHAALIARLERITDR